MNEWTLGSFLVALLGVILGGAAVGFVVQRTWFKDLRVEDPIVMLKRRERNKLHNSLGVLAGLAVLVLVYPLSCRLDGGMNVFGLSDETLTFLLILGGGLLLPLYLTWRNKRH